MVVMHKKVTCPSNAVDHKHTFKIEYQNKGDPI